MSNSNKISISKRKLALSVFSIILVCCLASGSLIYVVAQGGSTPITITSGVYPGAPSYTIYTDGSTYYAKNSYGVKAFPSTSANNTITSAINALTVGRLVQEKILLSGDIHLTNTINIPSFTIIQIEGAVYLEGSSNTNVFAISNSYQVTITGGSINANKAGQASTSNAISITDSTYIDVNNVFIANAFLAGIYAHNVNSSKISSCSFKDNGNAATEMSGSIYWSGGEHNTIIGNNFDDGSFAEVMCANWLHPVNDFTISGNEMINSFFGVVYCGNFGTISGNTLNARSPCDAGIYINGRGSQGDINTITGNTISGHMDGIGLEDSYGSTVSGNTIYATWGGHGIYVFGATYSTNNTISGNTMFNIAKNGILLSNASYNIVSNNRITDVNNDPLEGVFSGINETSSELNLYSGNYMDSSGGIVKSDLHSRVVNTWNGSTFIQDTNTLHGTVSIADANTVTHNFGYTPQTIIVTAREAEIVANVPARDGSLFYISLRFAGNGTIPVGSHIVDYFVMGNP